MGEKFALTPFMLDYPYKINFFPFKVSNDSVIPQILISVCLLSPTSGNYWVKLGFINNYKEL